MTYEKAKNIINAWLTSGDLKDKEWIEVMRICLSLINEKLDNYKD